LTSELSFEAKISFNIKNRKQIKICSVLVLRDRHLIL
jgi:hypothetical protein